MLRKIKKLFSLLPLVLLGLLFPNLSSAGVLADLGTFIVTRPFFGIAWVLAKIAIYLVGLAGSLLNWVLSPNFIRMSYTKPGPAIPNNPIIETGLGVTQGFVNMLLVLVLVYIAIATILRLAGYETKKLLVTFIIVALLVNFAPVICGLIVDASNIVMNFFVQDLKADAFGNEMGRKVSDISSGFEWLNVKAGEDWGRMFQLLIMAGFLFYLCLILGIFTLIFILRYLVIWLLVILSPLAFVCYILPATRKYFEQWWEQFLAWSFIGVTCGFFLYLGLLMVSLVPTAIIAPTTGQGGAFDPILPYFVSAVFLGLGIFFGLQTSALGAKTAVNIATTKGKATAEWTKKQGWKATKTTGAAMAGAFRGAREGEGVRGRISGAARGALTFEGRERGRENMGRMLERMHLVKPGFYEESRRKRWKIEDEAKRLKALPTDRLHEIAQRRILRPADRAGSIAAFELLAERSALHNQEAHLLPRMQSFGADTSKALKARPDWAPLVGRTVSQQVAGTSTQDFTKNTQAEALRNIEVVVSLDTPKIQHIGLRGKTEQKRALRQTTAPQSATLEEITNRLDQLLAQETPEANQEAERTVNIIAEIQGNPNFQSP